MPRKIKNEKRKEAERLTQASLARRFLAYIIDWYVGALATALPISIIAKKLSGTMLDQAIVHFEAPWGLVGGILGLICAVLYYVITPLYWTKGQTLGKRICKIKIVQADDQEVTAKNILLRQVVGLIIIEGSLVSASTIWHQVFTIVTGIDMIRPLMYVGLALVAISCLLVAFHKEHKAIHDYLGNTRVVSCE